MEKLKTHNTFENAWVAFRFYSLDSEERGFYRKLRCNLYDLYHPQETKGGEVVIASTLECTSSEKPFNDGIDHLANLSEEVLSFSTETDHDYPPIIFRYSPSDQTVLAEFIHKTCGSSWRKTSCFSDIGHRYRSS